MNPYYLFIFFFFCFSLITTLPWVFSSSSVSADNSISGDSQFTLFNPNPNPNAGILDGYGHSPGGSSSLTSEEEGGSELDVYNPGSSEGGGLSRSPGRSLLAVNDDYKTRLVALLDGTINLVDSNSRKVLWSFSTGPPIYSSYQVTPHDDDDDDDTTTLDGETKAPPHVDALDGGTRPFFSNKYFIDMGVDWKLYMHGNIFGKVKLEMTISEYLNSLPHISEDGRVTTGSKKTTLFKVDGYSGKINASYGIGDSNVSHSIVPKEDVENMKKSRTLYITRTDYSIVGFASSGEVLWNLTAAEIGDALLCEGDKLPRKCLTKSIDIHLRSNNIAEAFEIHALPNTNHESNVLPHIIPSSSQKYNDQVDNHDSKYLPALPTPNEENFVIIDDHSSMWKTDLRSMASKVLGSLISFLLVLWYMGLLTVTRYNRDTKQFTESRKNQAVVPKRKKARKLGNNKKSANSENNERSISSEEGEKTNRSIERNDKESWLDLTKPINGGSDGRMVGKLFVSNTIIAKGSNGTVVLEGDYETRPVAVKRLVRSHHDVAFKEIQNLIASDRHQNIVRWYGVEYDSDFVYLSLERCMCSLNDLIQICSDSSQNSVFVEDRNVNSVNEYNVSLDSLKENNKDIELWRATGYPSPQLLKMMRDVVSGLAHLHELGIIHRDLKPQNVLILKERSLCAKLSDMGISKRLIGDMSSFSHGATGYGSSGWQAPEQLLHGRQTRAVDLFSLGCVLFFCITGGKHPFGDRLERDINIVKNRVDLFMVEHIPEADDLLSHLLDADPESRPKAVDVLHHPLFWNSEMRLSFLRDTSDRVELEDRESESDLLKALEGVASVALGGKWDEKMEAAFINNIGRYRRYKFDSTRDLLRVIRNKLNHYRELPKEIQELLGPIPEGFDGYFMSRFPKFLIEVYKVMYRYCKEEECFRKYFTGEIV